jgi:hypothetical protein
VTTGNSIYKVFKTSEQAENEGQWFDYGPGPSGENQRFCLARMGRSNKKYTGAIQRMQTEYGRQLDSGTLADSVAHEVLLHIFCTTILVNWTGICDENDEALPYSVENAKQLLTDLPDLYQELQSLAQSREHYRLQQNEADAGN